MTIFSEPGIPLTEPSRLMAELLMPLDADPMARVRRWTLFGDQIKPAWRTGPSSSSA